MTLAHGVVFGYLAIVLVLGIVAGRRGGGGVADFVAGDRAFGPLLMYFVMGATVFSAYALLGTPQRVVSKGSDAFYILAYGAVGFVPVYFFGARVRKARCQAGSGDASRVDRPSLRLALRVRPDGGGDGPRRSCRTSSSSSRAQAWSWPP